MLEWVMPADKMSLFVTLDNKAPVELEDFSNSFYALSDEYKRFLSKNHPGAESDDTKLFISQVKTGSIIAELQTAAGGMLPLLEHAKTIVEFGSYLKMAYEYLLGRSSEKPEFDKKSYQNFSQILEPVAKDNASQIIFQPTINGNPTFNFNLNSVEANAAQNRAAKHIESLKERIVGRHNKVVLYWYQARNEPTGHAGDRAIIESISPLHVKCTFFNEALKQNMLLGADNPFNFAYELDVDVETVNDKPALYKIVAYYQRFEKPQ